MDKLTKSQQRLLIEHMKQYEDDSWEEHVLWARNRLGAILTPDECCKLYMESIFR